MYVVIFKATVRQFDDDYSKMATELRDLALAKYECIEFIAVTENNQEIALSYWQNENDIRRWKQDAEHLVAQKIGREKWYQNYQIEIAEIKRVYQSNNENEQNK